MTAAAGTLKARGIAVHFEGLTAVDDVSITLEAGEILGLIGPNGAGKSTLVNVLTGFQRPSRGRVLLGDVNITRWAPDRIARSGLARTFQSVRRFQALSVLENLAAAAVGAGLGRRAAEQRALQILEGMSFAYRAHNRADSLPYGEERRVGIGRALAMAPRFLLLDEPAAGLSDAECDELVQLIRRIPQEHGCGILLIEHNMRVIMNACPRIHVIEGGRTLAEGTPAEIRRNAEVVRAYLGSKSEGMAADART